MSRPAVLANENFPVPALRLLRVAGVNITAVAEIMRGASDRQVLAHAHEHGLWVLTFDRDYGELVFARAVAAPPAIIYLRQEAMAPAALCALVLALLDDPDFAAGHLLVAAGRTLRRRALPSPL